MRIDEIHASAEEDAAHLGSLLRELLYIVLPEVPLPILVCRQDVRGGLVFRDCDEQRCRVRGGR